MSERTAVLIVGGGVSGLATAAMLAAEGLPVTVVESGRIGGRASTRNQGWLFSGAWFAPCDVSLAQECLTGLQQTVNYCPECLIESDRPGSVFFLSRAESDPTVWTEAWFQAGISFAPLARKVARDQLGGIIDVSRAWRLPDRTFNPEILVQSLARDATAAGAIIRTATHVRDLLTKGTVVEGVRLGNGNTISAETVVIAGGAAGAPLWAPLFPRSAGAQHPIQLIRLQAHLLSVSPAFEADSFCALDRDGFTHHRHHGHSIFSSQRWRHVERDSDEKSQAETQWLSEQLAELYRGDIGRREITRTWAGTTVQAMCYDQIFPGAAPRPTVVDHRDQVPRFDNLFSIFPGRATLWAPIAEAASHAVLDRLGAHTVRSHSYVENLFPTSSRP